MKLGLAVEYASKGVHVPIDLIQRCEALGYDSVWSAEAYGSDALTPLAYIAAHTKKHPARNGCDPALRANSPAMTAMQLRHDRGRVGRTRSHDRRARRLRVRRSSKAGTACALGQPQGEDARLRD